MLEELEVIELDDVEIDDNMFKDKLTDLRGE